MARSALMSVHEALPDFPVWSENWDAVQLFMAASTQWRLDAMGRRSGLDYRALDWPMRHLRLRGRRAREAFDGMRTMEAAFVRRALKR